MRRYSVYLSASKILYIFWLVVGNSRNRSTCIERLGKLRGITPNVDGARHRIASLFSFILSSLLAVLSRSFVPPAGKQLRDLCVCVGLCVNLAHCNWI